MPDIFRPTWHDSYHLRRPWIGTKAGAAVVATPDTLALVITTYAPLVSTPRLVTPPTRALTLTTFAPAVLTPRVVTPGVLALTIISFAPTVSTPLLVVPPTRALSLTAYAPAVLTPRLVTPSTLALTLTTFAPTVTVTTNVTVTPTTLALVLTTYAPTVTATGVTPVVATEPLRGVPAITRRRRLRPVELEGVGLVVFLGVGELSAGRALAGELYAEFQGEGSLSRVHSLREMEMLIPVTEADMSIEAGLCAEAVIASAGLGDLRADIPLAGEILVPIRLSGRVRLERSLTGVGVLRTTGSGGGYSPLPSSGGINV